MGTGIDPLSTIMSLMNTISGAMTAAQQQQLQQQVYGQQQSGMAFAQNPAQMNQYITALQSPYAFGNLATPGTASQYGSYLAGLTNPYGNIANPTTGAGTNAYLQSLQTPYSTALGAQDPNQMNSLISQYTQGLNSGLTSGVWNATQGQLAGAGLSQAPGVATYDYAQALAPYMQQNQQTAAALAQAPLQYGLNEQQLALQAGQMPLQYGLNEQQIAGQLGTTPLNYGLNAAQLGIGESQYGLSYPLNIGSGLAGMFPNYSYAAGA